MSFTVVHFAGAVSYDGTNFMDKNMDELGELLKLPGSFNYFNFMFLYFKKLKSNKKRLKRRKKERFSL